MAQRLDKVRGRTDGKRALGRREMEEMERSGRDSQARLWCYRKLGPDRVSVLDRVLIGPRIGQMVDCMGTALWNTENASLFADAADTPLPCADNLLSLIHI